MATKKQIATVVSLALAEAQGFIKGASLDKPEHDNLSIPQALEKRNEAIKRKMHEIKVDATRVGIEAAQSNNAPTRPRIKHIPYKQALAILERLNCPKERHTPLRWMKGKNTPDGFTPETMASVEAFTAWATIYAHREQAKINVNNALRIDNPKNRKMQTYR